MTETPDAAPAPLGPGEVVLAFDVGGTDTKSAIVDADGRVLGLRRTPTPLDGDRTAEAVVGLVAELAAGLRAAHPGLQPVAAGLLVPGIVDAERGVGVYASNLGWHDAPIRDLAEAALGLPVAFHHDVTAASWAEHRLGAARAYDDVVVLVIGTGIAGLADPRRPAAPGRRLRGRDRALARRRRAAVSLRCVGMPRGRRLGRRHRAALRRAHRRRRSRAPARCSPARRPAIPTPPPCGRTRSTAWRSRWPSSPRPSPPRPS